ncbi:DNA-directed RNA polymerases I and III subunit RPAC2-like isoform X2 [Emydura macquarii macquarii]|uniref:DNA-directed RNA polymerases I and III subunit RPAC2-like isoform X2 n=1 Tax=Emydura macquarii macquarii TaxID=1129001 RepID=UPI00352ADDB4
MADEEVERKPVLEMVQADGTDGSCITFVLHDEDHTLGNSLRYMIMKNSEVEFCGYSITHPSESKINFRIQTRGELPAVEPFRRGLTELVDVCQHVLSKFECGLELQLGGVQSQTTRPKDSKLPLIASKAGPSCPFPCGPRAHQALGLGGRNGLWQNGKGNQEEKRKEEKT